MNEIVKYNNDLHKLSLAKFTELEQNLLFGVLVKCREQNSGVEIELKADDLMGFINQRKNTTKQDLLDIAVKLRENFFKLDFSRLKQKTETNEICDEYYNLFSFFKIYYYEKNETHQNDYLSRIVLKVNDDFAYLLHEFTNGLHTQFELEEFLYLRGKYPKILYRLLKQFRVKGYFIAIWQNFKEQMGIPPSFSNEKIETLILKPCVEKLSETIKTNLFDARIPFENLEYKLKKQKSHRGKPQVTHIEFYFKPQEASCLDERQKYLNEQNAKKPLKPLAEPKEPHYITVLRELCVKKAQIKKLNDKYSNIKLIDINKSCKEYYLMCQVDFFDEKLSYLYENQIINFIVDYNKAQNFIKAYEKEQK